MLPNFLIVGAAKSGTSSLYYYLKEHPEIFMSEKKEPHYFFSVSNENEVLGIAENIKKEFVDDLKEYKSLFDPVYGEKIIGEASVENLFYYEKVIPEIKKLLGEEVKILIILREPVSRAISSYNHFRRNNLESESFNDAIKKDKERLSENYWFLRSYISPGFYYDQVRAYIENFKSVKIILHDDLKKDVIQCLKEIYDFLGVNPDFIPDNINVKYNVSGNIKNNTLHNLIFKENIIKKLVKKIVSFFLSEKRKIYFREIIRSKILKKEKVVLHNKDELKSIYKDDILKLQKLINKDLGEWL